MILEIPINILRPSTYTLLPERVRIKRADLAEGRVSRNVMMMDRSGASPDVRMEAGESTIETNVRRESSGVVRLKVTANPGARSTTARVLVDRRPVADLPIDIVD